MNTGKYILAGLVGAGLGVAGTYKYFKDKYDKKATEEINSLISYYENEIWDMKHNRSEEKCVPLKDIIKDERREKTPEDIQKEKERKEYEVIASIYSSNDEKVETEEVEHKEYDEDSDDRTYEEAMKSLYMSDNPIEDEPYVISETDYSETCFHYEKETLHYFIEDKVLWDPSANAPVVNISATIGEQAFDLLPYSDHSSLYFRNEVDHTDYEVIRVSGHYYDDNPDWEAGDV